MNKNNKYLSNLIKEMINLLDREFIIKQINHNRGDVQILVQTLLKKHPKFVSIKINKYGMVTNVQVTCDFGSPFFFEYKDGNIESENKRMITEEFKKKVKTSITKNINLNIQDVFYFNIRTLWFKNKYGIGTFFQVPNNKIEKIIKPSTIKKIIKLLIYICDENNKDPIFISQNNINYSNYFGKVLACPKCNNIQSRFFSLNSTRSYCPKCKSKLLNLIINNPDESNYSEFIKILLSIIFIASIGIFYKFYFGNIIISLNSILISFIIFVITMLIIISIPILLIMPSRNKRRRFALKKLQEIRKFYKNSDIDLK